MKPICVPCRRFESDILYQSGNFWVRRATPPVKGFEVWRSGGTCSVRVARIGYAESDGLRRAIDEADRRAGGRAVP